MITTTGTTATATTIGVTTSATTTATGRLLQDLIARHQTGRQPAAAPVTAPAPAAPLTPPPAAAPPPVAAPAPAPPVRPAPAPRPTVTLYSTALCSLAKPSTDISLLRAFISIVTGAPVTNLATPASRQLAEVGPLLHDISAALRLHDALDVPDAAPSSILYYHITGRRT